MVGVSGAGGVRAALRLLKGCCGTQGAPEGRNYREAELHLGAGISQTNQPTTLAVLDLLFRP